MTDPVFVVSAAEVRLSCAALLGGASEGGVGADGTREIPSLADVLAGTWDAEGIENPFSLGDVVRVTGSEGRHAVSVKRLTVGETVVLTDGENHAARGAITAVAGKDSMTVQVSQVATLPPRNPRVVVVQAIPKSERAELAVDLATQAGADAIVPWQALRCVSKWTPGAKTAKARGKWAAAAKAAAKQSRRWDIPPVTSPATTGELASAVHSVVESGGCALMLDEEGATPFAEVIQRFMAERGAGLEEVGTPSHGAVPSLMLIVGPEGGIDPSEREQLAEAGARAVVLGPEILRTASAAAVALGALGALTPRWAPIMKF